jgi:hypothetical protein
MIAGAFSLAIEGIVSVLLVAVIVYASRLNRRLADLRGQGAELQEGIARFDEAAARAEAAAARLKAVGAEAERSVRAALDRAQAVRDELMFLADRGAASARAASASAKTPEPGSRGRGRRERAASPAADGAGAAMGERPERQSGGGGTRAAEAGTPRSAAERELLKAIRAAHGAR